MMADMKEGSNSYKRLTQLVLFTLIGIGIGALLGSVLRNTALENDETPLVVKREAKNRFNSAASLTEHEKIRSTHHKNIANLMKGNRESPKFNIFG